ncbi:hypothetical protein [Bacillus sp. AK128]
MTKMIEERLDRIEGMLKLLIQMVEEMLERQDSRGNRMDFIENNSEERHQAIINQINTLGMDQDFISERQQKGKES